MADAPARTADPAYWPQLRRRLEGLPSDPRPHMHPSQWVRRAKRGADFVGHSRYEAARFFARINPYPKPFEHVTLRTEDNVRIAGWLGPHRPTAPSPWGLLLVPGMFSTKDDTAHKRRAIWLWRKWRIPVLSIDLRSFGESRGISTAGWKEANDVLAGARFLRDTCHVDRVAVVAESLGGAATLNAAGLAGAEGDDIFDGGILTWSAFVDARDAVEYISAEPDRDHPFASQWAGFRRLLHIKSMGGYLRFTDYLDDAARVNGLPDLNALYDIANPKNRVGQIRAPTLNVHATDDPVVPVRHARRMERYAADLLHIQTMIKPWGGHTNFESRDTRWYWEVMRQWFGAVNDQELPSPLDGRRLWRR